MKNKSVVSIVILTVTILLLTAQNKISFAYDANGNRVRRELIISPTIKSAPRQSDGKKEYYDSLGERTIKITHNSSGQIDVCIVDLQEGDEGFIDIYSLNGIQIFYQEISDNLINIDIGVQSNGIYILRVVVNNNQTTWKISKQ